MIWASLMYDYIVGQRRVHHLEGYAPTQYIGKVDEDSGTS